MQKSISYAKILADRVKSGLMSLEELENTITSGETLREVKRLLSKSESKPKVHYIEEIEETRARFYTIKETAELLTLKQSTVSVYIHSNHDFIQKFVKYVEGRGAHGKRLLITQEGFTFLSSVDWNARRQRSPYKNAEPETPFQNPSFLFPKNSISHSFGIQDKMAKVKNDLEALDRLGALNQALNIIYGDKK